MVALLRRKTALWREPAKKSGIAADDQGSLIASARMVNRRGYYRQALLASGAVPVDLIQPDGILWHGTMIELSVAGMSAQLPGQPPDDLAEDRWFVSFTLLANEPEVFLPARLIHCQAGDRPIAGFGFLPLIDPRADAEAKRRIAAFLLAAQCQERRQRRSRPGALEN
jgi:c-di-GMP-binding flagellar brake protein YcgR